MKNAHERFGRLMYRRQTEKTATNLRVSLDAFMGEERGKAHLVSVVGGDVEIGALAAAFANGDSFSVMDPYGNESIVSLGEKPMCYRGSIVVSGRKRPLRHLVSCSQELADNTSDGKLLLVSDDQLFIWSSLVCHYGLPATPEWRSWMISQLRPAETNPNASRFWVLRSRYQGQAKGTIGSFEERTADSSACVSVRKRRSRMARDWPPEESGLES